MELINGIHQIITSWYETQHGIRGREHNSPAW